jgi:hypothetical protein
VIAAFRAVVAARAELLTAIAILLGWAFLTSAIAVLARPDVVWRASAGLFLLSLCGWKFLYAILSNGLYKLTRKRG